MKLNFSSREFLWSEGYPALAGEGQRDHAIDRCDPEPIGEPSRCR